MTYSEAIDYLYNSRPYGKIKYGLFRMEELMQRLGNPQNDYPVIHITGTNGKGSVAAMLQSVLSAHGFRTGLNISPHIVTFRERIQLNGSYISEDEVVDLIELLKPHLQAMDARGIEYAPSFFEVVTAMSFLYFKRREVDAAVIEVGLGGRYDASNILASPVVSVITSVGLDHTGILGDTEEKIAFEKAGIIKKGRPVVTGVTRPSLRKFLKEVAVENQSPIYMIDRDFAAAARKYSPADNVIDYWGGATIKDIHLSLNGVYQLPNAAITLKTLEVFFGEMRLPLDENILKEALSHVIWPGRFELFKPDSKTIILDGGHNPAGVKVLRDSIEAYYPGRKIDILYGSLDDKDFESNITLLEPVARKVVVTRVPNHRSVNPEKVYQTWKKHHHEDVIYIESPVLALEELKMTGTDPFLCCGSLYLISELRNLLIGGEVVAGRY